MNPTSRQRGKHPNDDRLFSAKWLEALRLAVDDHSYLLSHGYGGNAALELVGNRYKLNKRQRQALLRISAAAHEIELRQAKKCTSSQIREETVAIDGFNLLILLENAYSGAYVFHCRDGCYRDISSVHGSYKHIRQTAEAIVLVGRVLEKLQAKAVHWLLDRPVSNSGRLKEFLLTTAAEQNWNWQVELCYNPDQELARSTDIVVSSDGWVLDQTQRWFNLGQLLLEEYLAGVNIVRV